MQLVTVGIGYFVGGMATIPTFTALVPLMLGTWLVASGAGALNHMAESDIDSKMERTKDRPIPSGNINTQSAMIFGAALCVLGVGIHFLYVNQLTALLSALTVFLYVLVYTPLKKRTWLNTLVGAIPGALPLLGGWTAATGTIHPIAWSLFIVLFAWQHPHFYALAIMYEKDYERGGLKMLPVIEEGYSRTARQTLIYTVMMIVASLFTYFVGLMGVIYLVGICLLNVMMTWFAVKMARDSGEKSARKLFFASIIYLPGWFVLIVLDYYIMPILR